MKALALIDFTLRWLRRKNRGKGPKMADKLDDLGIPMKPDLATGQRAAAPMPARSPILPPRGASYTRPNGLAPPAEPPRRSSEAQAERSEAEVRKLIVGRGITLSGEITSCDKLIVEGSVEVNLANCHYVEIAESGLFNGSASIDEAEIRGRFEGTLTCRERLLINATGRVSGTICYGQIEIERGGQISGDIQAQAGSEDEVSPEKAIAPAAD